MFKTESFSIALEQLELSLNYEDGLESYTFIHKIFDIFNRLISNVKTQLLNFNKKFKRSELHLFHDSKKFGISNLYKKTFFNRDLMVPIPSGMKVSYNTAVDKVFELFDKLNIEETADILLSYLKQQSSESPDIITNKISRLTKKDLEKDLQSIFSSTKTLNVPLGKVFENFQDFKQVDNKLLKGEDLFKKVSGICDKLDLIEKAIDKIITDLETQKDIDRVYVKALHGLVKTAAFQFDALGVLLDCLQVLEHNFVLVFAKLVISAAKE